MFFGIKLYLRSSFLNNPPAWGIVDGRLLWFPNDSDDSDVSDVVDCTNDPTDAKELR
jgi:hypothetical protein